MIDECYKSEKWKKELCKKNYSQLSYKAKNMITAKIMLIAIKHLK